MSIARNRAGAFVAACLAGGLATAVAMAANPGPTPVPYQWRNVAIGGGGFVTGLTYHPHQQGLAYARTDVGGAYRWDAELHRWQPLTDWIDAANANLTGIESLAIDPADPARLYLAAGTYTHERAGNGAILRSRDQGRSFERVDLPFKLGGNELSRGNGERLAVDPNDGKVIYLGTRAHGLWRSTDAGAHWQALPGSPSLATSASATAKGWNRVQSIGIVFVVFDAGSGQPGQPTPHLYAGVSSRDGGLFESRNAGATWQAVAGQPTGLRPNHMVGAGDGIWYLSYGDEPGPDTMGNGALWKYDARQGRWSDVSPAAQSTDTEGNGFGWGAVAVDPTNPQRLYASTFNRFGPHDDIFRSTDGGQHWQPVFERSQFDHATYPWTAHNRPHWMADLEVDPYNPDELMFVTGYGIWASRNLSALDGDGTVKWWFKDRGLEETVPLDLLSPAEGAPLLSALGDIDGFRHDDLDQPTLQYAGPRLTNGESIANAGLRPLRVVRTGTVRHREHDEVRAAWSDDGGQHWQSFASEPPEGEGAGHITVAADGERVLWQPSKAGAWITGDFGVHWTRVSGLPATARITADRVQPAIYYAFDGASGDLYISGDGGIEFQRAGGVGAVGEGFRPELHAQDGQAGVVYVGAGWRGLFRWSAKGLQKIAGVEDARSFGLGKPLQEGGAPTLFVAGRVQGVEGLFRSSDEGRHWRRIDDAAHRFGEVYRVTGDPRRAGRVYFATGGRGIFYGDPE